MGLSGAVQEVCEAKLGQSRERLRLYTFEDVQAANSAGNCWLILDGGRLGNTLEELTSMPHLPAPERLKPGGHLLSLPC